MSATRACHHEDLSGCPCTGATLDKLIQPAILAVLARAPAHGYALAERIGAMPGFAGQRPDASGVYRALKSMEGKGLVRSAWDVSQAGPAKKTYHITPGGRDCLRLWVRTLEAHGQAVAALLKTARRAARK